MTLRDHQPVDISKFMGLWSRGDVDNTPLDHFTDCENIAFRGNSSFETRPGIGLSQTVAVPLSNIKRLYNYPTQTGNTLMVLAFDDGTNTGTIYHVVDATTVFGPILTIVGMTDFAFQPYAGRGYISPFSSFLTGGLNVEKGLAGEFLYVYRGDGTAATPAAGLPLAGTMTVANGAAGHTDPGRHLFGFVSETDTGYLSPPGLLTSFITAALSSVSFGSVDVSADPHVIARHLVATKVLPTFNGDLTGYQYFYVPNATIPNNTDNFLNDISFYDADLLEDASHLFDNLTTIPAGAVLTLYRDRLCLSTTFTDISLIYVSESGEPEAFNAITGLMIMPLDGNPITNMQELRDILYTMKRARTGSFTDNSDVPSTWPYVIIDQALGTSVHGIGTVLDSGSSSVDFLVITTYQGISLFNGKYNTPELSWKIEQFWKDQERNEFRKIQILNASIQKEIYIVLPDRRLLVGNYALGFDYKNIRWAPWSFFPGLNTVAVVNIDEIILGCDLVIP